MKTAELTIGLDLGDRRHHACVLDADGEILAEELMTNTREVLTTCLAEHAGATVIMETGTHSPWGSQLASSLGHPVVVANARKLRAISQSQTQLHREDAQLLARLGRADPQLRPAPANSPSPSLRCGKRAPTTRRCRHLRRSARLRELDHLAPPHSPQPPR